MIACNVQPSSYSYHKLMQGHAFHGDIDNVRRVLKEAESNGIEINKEMISTLVSCSLSLNDLTGAVEFLEHYSGIKPFLKTFIDFVRVSVDRDETEMTERAVEVLKKNGVSLDAINHTLMFAMLRLA